MKLRTMRTLDERMEIRAAADGTKHIVGYAAVFNRLSDPIADWAGWGYREKVAKGAFTKTLQEADVRALFNHDPALVLGRNKAGTLVLTEDDHGLHYDVAPPDTQAARDLMANIERGDISGSSFAFQAVKDEWKVTRDETTGKTTEVRTLLEVKLFDVGPVTYPAYPDSESAVRALLQEVSTDFDELLAIVSRRKRGVDLTGDDHAAIAAVIANLRTYLPSEPDVHSDGAPKEAEPVIDHSIASLRRRMELLARA